jgi:5-methylcytosine-specific restriction endonuclease McrA
MNNCKYCQKSINKGKYCSVQCQANERRNICIEKWKRKEIVGHKGKVKNITQFVRFYMLNKSNHQCSKCGWDKRHPITGKTPLEINHIDGNASNTWEENLEVLCPNCHSLTSSYRNYNKGKGKRVR